MEAACRAYVYSAPTVADIDHDGKLETIIGTSVGFVYVLDFTGAPLKNWPQQMGEVQAQVATADVDGDGFLELLALDTRGNAALFNLSGSVLWDAHVRSPVAQPASFGDIDGDGRLEVVFGSASGEVHVLDALTGAHQPCSGGWFATRCAARRHRLLLPMDVCGVRMQLRTRTPPPPPPPRTTSWKGVHSRVRALCRHCSGWLAVPDVGQDRGAGDHHAPA